jgi:catechol 2,3-dioxygenase-like lactoylglutathione lyase family enzyme
MCAMTDEAPTVLTSNTIIYCDDWTDVVAFYRTGLGLRTTMDCDWFVEFELHPGSHLSVADANHATVHPGNGSGLTLSWSVDDVDAARAQLTKSGIEASAVRTRWGSRCFFVFDPAGNRIEFWAGQPATKSTETRSPRP